MEDSYIKNSFIKPRDNENIFEINLNKGEEVTSCRLNGYAIVPLEDYIQLEIHGGIQAKPTELIDTRHKNLEILKNLLQQAGESNG